MADLTPQPISTFPEITNLNGFNNDSLITLLNANASTAATKNANLKFKNLYSLVKSNLNLTDADINTGIVPANINTNQLASISSITVNQYGRITQIAGSAVANTAPQTGVVTGFATGEINVLKDYPVFGPVADFTCLYKGNVVLTINFTSIFTQKSSSIPSLAVFPEIPIYVTNNTNNVIKASFVPQIGSAVNIYSEYKEVITGSTVIVLPASVGLTNWKIGTGSSTYFNRTLKYSILFQNNAQ